MGLFNEPSTQNSISPSTRIQHPIQLLYLSFLCLCFYFIVLFVLFDTLFILIQHLRHTQRSRNTGACPIPHSIIHIDTHAAPIAVNADGRGFHPVGACALHRGITAFLFLTCEIDGHLKPSTPSFPKTNRLDYVVFVFSNLVIWIYTYTALKHKILNDILFKWYSVHEYEI